MEWKYMRGTGIALVAALALGLAGCGSSGDSDTAADDTPVVTPEPMPTPVAVTVPDAGYLDADNMPMAGMLMIAAGMTGTSGGVTFLCAAGGDDCEVTIADDGGVMATGGTVTASLTADAMMQVADAKDMKADEILAARDRLIGKDRALEGASNLGLTGTNGLDEDEIRISRAAGKGASVRSTGYVASEMMAPANGDWAGTRLMRPVSGATQHLFVYTDIAPPTRVQFYNWDGVATTTPLYANATMDALTSPFVELPGTSDVPPLDLFDGSVNWLSRSNLDAGKFMSPGPAEGGTITQRFPVARVGDTTVSFQGNFNGAAGTYICTGAANGACTVTISPSGVYSEGVGTWTFTPEVGATAWRTDRDFISFGWWLQEPTSANGSYSFQYYANGSQPFAAPTAVATGSATYNGRASGKYVAQEIGDAGVTGGMAGIFTAAATLNANFSPTANTISGRIHDIVGEDGAMTDWEVTLNRKSLGAEGNLANAFPSAGQPNPALPRFDGATATMGDQTAHGDWAGQFFGNTPRIPNAYPTGVGGTFQADNEAVSIAGAFGARR